MRMPGDALVGDPATQTTEAINIDAAPAVVWTLLMQFAQHLSGANPATTEDQTGVGRPRLGVGDTVQLTPVGWIGLPGAIALRVNAIEPEAYAVLHASPPDLPCDVVCSLLLQPHGKNGARLVIRSRIGLRHPGEVFPVEVARPLIALSTRRLLLQIKHRADQHPAGTSAFAAPVAQTA